MADTRGGAHAIAHGAVTATRVETYLLLDRGDGIRGSYGHFRRPNGDPPIEAKRSVTHIRPIAGLAGATLVECRLETGRQHQIRIHTSELGHPLVGERIYIRDYAGPKVPRNLPTVVQVTPERSSASHSRQATYTLSGIISISRLTGTRSGASSATIGATMFRLAFLKW